MADGINRRFGVNCASISMMSFEILLDFSDVVIDVQILEPGVLGIRYPILVVFKTRFSIINVRLNILRHIYITILH